MAKLGKIKQMLQSILSQFGQVTTDKGILQYDGEELEVGAGVVLVDEEGNESVAEDGNYFLGEEDGRTVVVENSAIKEIIEPTEEEPAEEPANEEVEAKKNGFKKIKQAFEESYAEKEEKIMNAIRAAGYDGWLTEAGDDYAIVEVWDELTMDYKHYRFSISWSGDDVIVGEFEEVKPAFVPVEEDVAKVSEEVREGEFSEETTEEVAQEIVEEVEEVVEEVANEVPDENAELKAKIEELEALIAELKSRIEALEGAPATEPAEEEFKSKNPLKKTGIQKVDRLIEIMSK